MSSDPSEDGRCNATTRDGTPCRKWPVGGAGEGRCRFHGGASTGAADTSHLEENDYAEGNSGGGAPVGNANAEIHGGFSDWKKAYERFDEDTRNHVDRLVEDMLERVAETAPDVLAPRRKKLTREWMTLMMLKNRTGADAWCSPDGSGPGRGFIVEKEISRDGETVTVEGANPALRAEVALSRRQREIAEELRLWCGSHPSE